jgi:hypothetical protein
MISAARVQDLKQEGRYIAVAQPGDPDLDVLKLLPGTWKNKPSLPGRGWNMIALPFASPPADYRLLVNQYDEELKFSLVDKGVKNRGIRKGNPSVDTDQVIVALDYEQRIEQINADDFPQSGLAGTPNTTIHHEPGLWLFMTNEADPASNLARLGTIPHGDSLLALGAGEVTNAPPVIPAINGLPIGVNQDLTSRYLEPYAHFNTTPFMGLFNPVHPHLLLENAVPGTINRTTKLEVSTKVESGGIVNIPFIIHQANAAEMISTFWIVETTMPDGQQRLILQYLQIVLLDFFPRRDGLPGLIRWPHVSINTMEKVAEPNPYKTSEPATSDAPSGG